MCVKCSDTFSAVMVDSKGNYLGEYDGYVPNFFPGEHYGDYIMLHIDTDTGRILNWKKPSQAALRELFSAENE